MIKHLGCCHITLVVERSDGANVSRPGQSQGETLVTFLVKT